jgi:hypothetical protein
MKGCERMHGGFSVLRFQKERPHAGAAGAAICTITPPENLKILRCETLMLELYYPVQRT